MNVIMINRLTAGTKTTEETLDFSDFYKTDFTHY